MVQAPAQEKNAGMVSGTNRAAVDRCLAADRGTMRAAFGRALAKRLRTPAFLIPLSPCYCTVTSVPTGISEKNLRAASSGNRMHPCDAG
jgi:hypothetical protein